VQLLKRCPKCPDRYCNIHKFFSVFYNGPDLCRCCRPDGWKDPRRPPSPCPVQKASENKNTNEDTDKEEEIQEKARHRKKAPEETGPPFAQENHPGSRPALFPDGNPIVPDTWNVAKQNEKGRPELGVQAQLEMSLKRDRKEDAVERRVLNKSRSPVGRHLSQNRRHAKKHKRDQ